MRSPAACDEVTRPRGKWWEALHPTSTGSGDFSSFEQRDSLAAMSLAETRDGGTGSRSRFAGDVSLTGFLSPSSAGFSPAVAFVP